MIAESGKDFSCAGIERVNVVRDICDETLLAAAVPVREAALGARCDSLGGKDRLRIEFPEELSGCGVERNDLLPGRVGEEGVADDERCGFEAAGLLRVISPDLFELRHIFCADLGEL